LQMQCLLQSPEYTSQISLSEADNEDNGSTSSNNDTISNRLVTFQNVNDVFFL
jgi:hypothetical protein